VAKRIGIDPGCSGAIVVLDDQGVPVDGMLMPTLKVGANTRVNGAAVAALLAKHRDVPVYLEQVGAMPGQGGASMFTFGHAAGLVQGVVVGAGNPLTLVTPQKWKKAAGLIGTEKDAARSHAILLWPHWRDLDAKGKGQALADAALIARFGG
jgi:crossover junction endodeoxyribonuclease RuvC